MKRARFVVTMILAAVAAAAPAWAFTASYDQKVTHPQGVMQSKVWVKDKHMRIEANMEGHEAIMIRNDEGFFNYMPAEGMAMKLPSLSPEQQPIQNIDSYEDYLRTQQARLVRSEKMNGYDCDVSGLADSSGQPVTTWVWKEKQFPVRVEMKSAEGPVVAELSNIQVGVAINDDRFQLPEGVQLMDMGAMGGMMQGMMHGMRGGAGGPMGAGGAVNRDAGEPDQQQMIQQMMKQYGGDQQQ